MLRFKKILIFAITGNNINFIWFTQIAVQKYLNIDRLLHLCSFPHLRKQKQPRRPD